MDGEKVCLVCNGAGLLRKDGQRIEVLTGPARGVGLSMADIQRLHDPCSFCALGKKEAQLWKDWNEEMAKPILPREAVGA
jgi:hypothetical protein